MCRLKSGILLRNRAVVAPGDNESHTDLLEELGIEDDYMGMTKKFVRAELVPEDGAWWFSPLKYPNKWHFVVDQDIVPDWFDAGTAEKQFRDAVCEWWDNHVLVGKEVEMLDSGFYRLKGCEVKKLCKDVKVLLFDSHIGVMEDRSQVTLMQGDSSINMMRGRSKVGTIWDCSNIRMMCENSKVDIMQDYSQVIEMCGNSQINVLQDYSRTREMNGSSQILEMWGNAKVDTMRDHSQIGEMWGETKVGVMLDQSQIKRDETVQ